MKNSGRWFLLLLFLMLALAPATPAREAPDDFTAWLDQLREEALAKGISAATLDAALADLAAPEPKVIERDQLQREHTISLLVYVSARV